MPKRSGKVPTPSWGDSGGNIRQRLLRQLSGKIYLVGGLVVMVTLAIVIVIVVFVSDFMDGQGRPGSTAMTVGNTEYTLEEFTDRWRLLTGTSGVPSQSAAKVVNRLTREEIARLFAEDFGVSVTTDDVDDRIHLLLGGDDDEITDEELMTIYEDELLAVDLTDEEYRRMTESQIYIDMIRDELAKDLPATAEQVKVIVAIVQSEQQGEQIIARFNEGEDFAEMLMQVDPSITVDVGLLEWEVKGTLERDTEDAIFAAEIGEAGGPMINAGELVIFQVVDKAVREVPESKVERLANRAFEDWAEGKKDDVEISTDILSDVSKFEWAVGQVYRQ